MTQNARGVTRSARRNSGRGVEQNTETAIQYYTKALEAADENLALENAAGNQAAQTVHDEAAAALERLK